MCGADFTGEFASGGAAYIPTGRSLAIQRQPFSLLYASFATPCLYPGLDLLIMLVSTPLACPTATLLLPTIIFCSSTSVALLFGTAMSIRAAPHTRALPHHVLLSRRALC